MGMLSGAALPKSVAGNIGAVGTAAAERSSMRPIVEAMRLPTNAKKFVHAWKNNANPAHIAGVGKFNLPARTMGAMDAMTTSALQRAGLTLEQAQELLLTNPNTWGDGWLGKQLRTPTGEFFVPFRNTSANTVAEGWNALEEMAGRGKDPTPRRRAMTVGAVGAGAAAGQTTDDPYLLAILAAFAGPRAIPAGIGMAASAGDRVVRQIGMGLPEASIEDLIHPLKAIDRPAILKLIEWLNGEDQ
jgi:hypothetical protein